MTRLVSSIFLAGSVLLALLGCATTVEYLPAAERPRPREHVTLEYQAQDGAKKPVDVTYIFAGEAAPGAELYVLVHGLATNADTWARVIDGFAEHGRTLAIDLPGTGMSGVPLDYDYAFEHQADVLRQFVERAPELAGLPVGTRPVMVGLSLGGGFSAFVVMRKMVDARALILAGPAGYPMDLPWFFSWLAGPLGPSILFGASLMDPLDYASRFYHRDEVKTPDLADMIAAQLRDRPHRIAMSRTFANSVALELARQVSAEIVDIDVPTLVLWGEKDDMIPPAHRLLWERDVKDSRVILVPDCGHSVPEEASAVYLQEVGSFLGW